MRLSAAVAPVAVLGFSVLAEGLGLAAGLRDVNESINLFSGYSYKYYK